MEVQENKTTKTVTKFTFVKVNSGIKNGKMLSETLEYPVKITGYHPAVTYASSIENVMNGYQGVKVESMSVEQGGDNPINEVINIIAGKGLLIEDEKEEDSDTEQDDKEEAKAVRAELKELGITYGGRESLNSLKAKLLEAQDNEGNN